MASENSAERTSIDVMAKLQKKLTFVLSANGFEGTVRAIPDWEKARSTCESIVEQAPMTCKANHTMVAGNTACFDLDKNTSIEKYDKNMVIRKIGLWYFYDAWRMCCIRTGDLLNEENPVNGYAQTVEEDIGPLRKFGEFIDRQLRKGQTVEVTISVVDGPSLEKLPQQPVGTQAQVVPIEAQGYYETLLEGGTDVLKAVILSKQNKFPARLLFIKSYTMTETTYFSGERRRFKTRERTVDQFKEDVHDHFWAGFNVFVFMEDMALDHFKAVGEQFKRSLEQVESMGDLDTLFKAMHVFFADLHALTQRLCLAEGWAEDHFPGQGDKVE